MFDFQRQDPEFAERFEHFAFNEVVNEPGQQLDDITRHLAILATLPFWPRCWAARALTPSGRSCPPLWTGASPR